MATLQELEAALVKADAAGNTDDARAFAAEIRKMRATPAAPVASEPSLGQKIKQQAGNLVAGAVRGAGSIGATLLYPIDKAQDLYYGDRGPTLSGLVTGQQPLSRNEERRQQMDAALQTMGAQPDSLAYQGSKLAGEIAGTAGIGGAVAPALKFAPRLASTVESAGFTTGAAPAVGLGAKAADIGLRTAGGAINGGLSAGLVNPEDAAAGAGVGAALPPVLKTFGAAGAKVAKVISARGEAAGRTFGQALGIPDSQLDAIVAAARNAPEELVSGSKLTLSQALQTQGQNLPGVKMLERIVSGGPGGDVLLKRYADQGEARLEALRQHGAQTYMGAPREEATTTGNRIASFLRTQAGDEQAAARDAWERLYGRANQDGVALELPVAAMRAATGPIGPGTVGAGRDAEALIREAEALRAARQGQGSTLTNAPPVQTVPFDEFQRLRRSAGELGARAGERGSPAESGVLNQLQRLLESRVDDAAAGNLRPGEVMPQGFREQYNAARDMTRNNAERYGQTNNIGAILRKPYGQDYALTGDEVTNKLWHGGAGLAGDVNNLKNVLSGDNYDPVMNALQKFIMTDAAGKTTAAGGLGAALPRYVETRMPGLQEALNPNQLRALTGVAGDIKNAEAAAAVPGLRGSDTQAKIMRALDAGMLDAPLVKTLSKFVGIKGISLEPLRAKIADASIAYKGRTMAELLADPKAAAQAIADRNYADKIDRNTFKALEYVARGAPALTAD